MRIVSRSMAITLAALTLAGRALAALAERHEASVRSGDDETQSVETVLHSFAGGSDGGDPEAGLIADEQGALYGTTLGGGSSGSGTVFKLTPPAKGRTAWTETVLYWFCSQPSCSDGAAPFAGLIADNRGLWLHPHAPSHAPHLRPEHALARPFPGLVSGLCDGPDCVSTVERLGFPVLPGRSLCVTKIAHPCWV
jgi:uncharacterized repeat protein (TIGR03803 family)